MGVNRTATLPRMICNCLLNGSLMTAKTTPPKFSSLMLKYVWFWDLFLNTHCDRIARFSNLLIKTTDLQGNCKI